MTYKELLRKYVPHHMGKMCAPQLSERMYVSRALSKVLEPESAAATFHNLAKKLIALLQKPSATASPALPAALKALGTLGQVAPVVFADHACSMADFVLDELLEAPMSSLSPSKARHLKAPVEGKAGASPHQGIVLKMLGLKVSLSSCGLIDAKHPKQSVCF